MFRLPWEPEEPPSPFWSPGSNVSAAAWGHWAGQMLSQARVCPEAPGLGGEYSCQVCIFALDYSTQNVPGTPQTTALQRKPTPAYTFPPLDPSCLHQPNSLPEVFPSATKNPPRPRVPFCSSRGDTKAKSCLAAVRRLCKHGVGNNIAGRTLVGKTQCPQRGGSGAPRRSLSPSPRFELWREAPAPQESRGS